MLKDLTKEPIPYLPADKLWTAEVALAAYTTKENVTRIVHNDAMSWLLEEPSFHRGKRVHGEDEALHIMIVSDMMRAGISLPTAAGFAVSIREQLLFYPANVAHIEFRRNGRLFAFVTDEVPEAAEAAGPVRFRLTIDLAGYRAAFREALAARQPAADRASA